MGLGVINLDEMKLSGRLAVAGLEFDVMG